MALLRSRHVRRFCYLSVGPRAAEGHVDPCPEALFGRLGVAEPSAFRGRTVPEGTASLRQGTCQRGAVEGRLPVCDSRWGAVVRLSCGCHHVGVVCTANMNFIQSKENKVLVSRKVELFVHFDERGQIITWNSSICDISRSVAKKYNEQVKKKKQTKPTTPHPCVEFRK